METNTNLKLSPPWYEYHSSVVAMFDRDPEVIITDMESKDGGVYEFTIQSANPIKLLAISELLRDEFQMGNITVKTNFEQIDPPEGVSYAKDIYNAAFSGNPIFKGIEAHVDPFSQNVTYYACIFKKEVIQFFNDDISDHYGNFNGLAQDIARNIFRFDNPITAGVNFTTSPVEDKETVTVAKKVSDENESVSDDTPDDVLANDIHTQVK